MHTTWKPKSSFNKRLLLLTIIYLAFISLGLPDSLLGSAWPVMHEKIGVPLSYAGVVTMIIACGTIVSSLLSDRLAGKFGEGLVTSVSVLMTAVALFGFSFSSSFFQLCIWAIPYGLGAGAVDASLNNYVALHYASRYMNWLHCFWGVGVSISPYIMGISLSNGAGWQAGYRSVSIIQAVLTASLFLSLPMWKQLSGTEVEKKHSGMTILETVHISGVPSVLIAFFAYSALEQTALLWGSSYLVSARGIQEEAAAGYAALFCIGITGGRFLSGFIADRLTDRNMIRLGIVGISVGIFCLFLPIPFSTLSFVGLFMTGLGCGPVYPAIVHSTPKNFGRENSQAVIGVQMASAYAGTTFMPPLFGVLSEFIGVHFYPVYLLAFLLLLIIMSEKLNRGVSGRNVSA